MANFTCSYQVPGGNGGKLVGSGFSPNRPRLNQNDTLTLALAWSGSDTPPNALVAYFIFSAAQDASSTQSGASPFVGGTGQAISYQLQQAPLVSSGGRSTYTFEPFTYNGGRPGSYELTVVVETGTGNLAITKQWSADPEFDTGS
jgi:hypothetical protein